MPRHFIFVIIVTIVLLGVLSRFPVFDDQVSRIAHEAARPLWSGGSALTQKTQSLLSSFESKRSLLSENLRLRDEVERLKAEMLGLLILKKENDELRAYLGVESRHRDTALSFVLTRPNRSPYDTLLIDKGENDGLRVGDLVSAGGGIAIGRVTFVSRNVAKVTLFSSPGVKTVVEIGPSTVRTEAVGLGGGNLEAKLPRGIMVEKGAAIALIQEERVVFGVVEVVSAEPSDSFQTLLFKLPVNIYELEWVEIKKTTVSG